MVSIGDAPEGSDCAGGRGDLAGPLTWRRLRADDLPLLVDWLREAQVVRWWHHATDDASIERDWGPSLRGEEKGEDLVVLLDGEPVGLVQRSIIADYPELLAELAAHLEVPDGAVVLDYLLASEALRGRGLGSRVIATLASDTWLAHPAAPAIIVPVVASNIASWRALEKAGFRRIAEGDLEPENSEDGPLHYIHRLDRPDRDRRPAAFPDVTRS